MRRLPSPPNPKFLRRLLYQRFPQSMFQEMKFEFDMIFVRAAQKKLRKKFRNQRNLKVNIGCGAHPRVGWVNLDAVKVKGVNDIDGLVDIRHSLPFENASVKAIFCEHVFEHLRFEGEVPNFLNECRRVLMPGGVLRLIVPDAGRYLRAYLENGWDTVIRMRQLGPNLEDRYIGVCWETKMELINQIFCQGGEHKFAWDAETLIRTLTDYFPRVAQVSFGESSLPEAAIDQERRASESLYVEARTSRPEEEGVGANTAVAATVAD